MERRNENERANIRNTDTEIREEAAVAEREEAALEAANQKRIEDARNRKLQKQSAIDRGDHVTYVNLGFSALESHDYETARSYAERANNLQPTHGAFYIFAVCAHAEGDDRAAAQWAQQALEGTPDGPEYDKLCEILLCDPQSVTDLYEIRMRLLESGQLSRTSKSTLKKILITSYTSLFDEFGRLKNWFSDSPEDHDTLRFMEAVAETVIQKKITDPKTLIYSAAVLAHMNRMVEVYELLFPIKIDMTQYDLFFLHHALLGRCSLTRGESMDATYLWGGSLAYGFISQPVHTCVLLGYTEALRELFPNPKDQHSISQAVAFAKGELSASQYFKPFYGDHWRSVCGRKHDYYITETGKEIVEDDDEDNEAQDASVMQELRSGFGNFFGSLFGK